VFLPSAMAYAFSSALPIAGKLPERWASVWRGVKWLR